MLLILAQWLQSLSPDFGFFRVFQYITFRAVMAALTALLIGLLAGPWVIKRLVSLKIGQPIRDYAMQTHEQEWYAHHGWRFDFDLHSRGDPVVVGLVQPFCMDCDDRDFWLWRHWVGR